MAYRIVLFLHVLLFAYWLGADLGVFVCAMIGRRKETDETARLMLGQAAGLIDMAPRSCLVLMVPAGLTLASRFGSPIHGVLLGAIWVAALAWLWLVWQVHLQHDSPAGRFFWKLDFAVRSLVMASFVGFGAWCLVVGHPIAERWLAMKIFLFGLIVLAGIIVRILLLSATPAPRNWIRDVVFGIWALVAMIAFLGVAKPF